MSKVEKCAISINKINISGTNKFIRNHECSHNMRRAKGGGSGFEGGERVEMRGSSNRFSLLFVSSLFTSVIAHWAVLETRSLTKNRFEALADLED